MRVMEYIKTFDCVFPGAVGWNRILQSQQYHKNDTRGDGNMVSWPLLRDKIPESCNVVILGEPGAWKTTLSLEMATRFRTIETTLTTKTTKTGAKVVTNKQSEPPSPATVIYYSLEQSRDSLRKRAWSFSDIEGVISGKSADDECDLAYILDGPLSSMELENFSYTEKNAISYLCQSFRLEG